MEGSSNNHDYEEHEMTSDSVFGLIPNTPDKRDHGHDLTALRSPMSVSFTPNIKFNDATAPSPFPISENIFTLHSTFASPNLNYGVGSSG